MRRATKVVLGVLAEVSLGAATGTLTELMPSSAIVLSVEDSGILELQFLLVKQ
jgi:hypothetical protein